MNRGGKTVRVRILRAMVLCGLVFMLTGCSPAQKQRVVLQGVPTDGVLSFAADEISSFLGNKYAVLRNGGDRRADWTIDLVIDKKMEDFSFSVKDVPPAKPGGSSAIELRGPDPTCVLHAAYTMLEQAGVSFDVHEPIVPPDIRLEKLRNVSQMIRPAVSRRGIRQHINFVMDISSYPLDEAKSYIRNLARLRMNYITFHSYPGQWYPYSLKEGPTLAGNFFYGQRHDIPDDPFLKSVVRNSKVYCIPAIEPFYDQPEEKSRRAIEWLQEVIHEAKRVGLTVNFSMELREKDGDRALASCEFVLTHYPEIDSLELITQEDGDDSSREIEFNAKMIGTLRGEETPRRNLEYGLGIYNTTAEDLKRGFETMRRVVPRDVYLTVLPAHGARVAVKNLKAIPIRTDDVSRTVFYSWVEFDGLMYLQQNPVVGIGQLIEEGRRLSGGAPLYGVCWNHWRTAENRTSIGYAAAAMVEGPIPPEDFYRRYGRALGIGDLDAYGAAMAGLDEADNDGRNNLFNIGFCYGGYWTLKQGLANYGRFKKDKIEASIQRFEAAREGLSKCVPPTLTPAGRRYLEFLSNRISCTLLHLQAFDKMTEIQPLFLGKNPKPLTAEDRKVIGAVCAEALALEMEYLKLHARMIEDRGCEGTLMSYYYAPLLLLKQIVKTYAGEGSDTGLPQKSLDAPPAPAEKNKK